MFAKHGLYLDGVSWRADLTENHAYQFCCPSGFRCRLHGLSCCISSKHGVWVLWVVSPGVCGRPKWKPCLANVRHGCGVGVGCCCPTEVSIGSPCRIPAKHGFGGNLVAAESPERGNHA